MRLLIFTFLLISLIALVTPYPSRAQKEIFRGDPVIIQVIKLDHADAGHLASVLAPLLSPEGRVVAYERTNSLIIKDRASVVRELVRIIKGSPDNRASQSLDAREYFDP